jgi:HAD superfamily hydrolase (TIGR01459 family)
VRRLLDRMGAPADSYDAIMSSGEACQRDIAQGLHGTHLHYVGPERDLHILTDTGREPVALEAADALLCTGLDDEDRETPDDYRARIAAWVARGIPMLCANPDIVVDRGETRLWCAGALARDFAAAGGEVIWFGKPHATSYDQSFARLAEIMGREVARSEVLAVGDGIATDVKGAADYGVDACFVTGGLAARELGTDPEHPDPDLLEAWLSREGQAPQFAIGRLR